MAPVRRMFGARVELVNIVSPDLDRRPNEPFWGRQEVVTG
jgi:hypothetical protein